MCVCVALSILPVLTDPLIEQGWIWTQVCQSPEDRVLHLQALLFLSLAIYLLS